MTTSKPSPPKPQPGRTAHPGARFAREHGPTARWTPDTYDLYLDLFSAPSHRRTREAAR